VCEALRERKHSALRAPTFKNVHTHTMHNKIKNYFDSFCSSATHFLHALWKWILSVHTKYIVMRQHDIESFRDPRVECILGNKANTARKWTYFFIIFECVQIPSTHSRSFVIKFISNTNIGG
jgi:hypothetical protein